MDKSFICIQKLYKSDVRSMINFMQSNQDVFKNQNTELNKENIYEQYIFNIIDDDVWQTFTEKLQKQESIEKLSAHVYDISLKYNIDKKNIIKYYINYIIRNNAQLISEEFLFFLENNMHSQDCSNQIYLMYTLSRLLYFFNLN